MVNDLERSRLGWIGAWLIGHLLTANRLTRHDAPLSVRRAYRAGEMTEMLRAAGLVPVRTIRGALGLRYAIAAVVGGEQAQSVAGDEATGTLAEPPDPRGAGEH